MVIFRSLTIATLLSFSALTGCSASSADGTSESEVRSDFPKGDFEAKPATDAVFHEGDVFHVTLGQYEAGDPWLGLQVISPLCGKQCTGQWVLEHADSVDHYEVDEVKVDTAKKQITTSYLTYDEEANESTHERKFSYVLTAEGIELREGQNVFKLPKLAPEPQADAKMVDALKTLLDDGSLYDESAPPPGLVAPMTVRRAEHFWNQNAHGFDATLRFIVVGGYEFWALDQNHDGGGSTDFYTKDGLWVNSYGGGESTDWEWTR